MSNTDLETTILGNPIPCFLLDRILNEKLDYLIQPICGSDKKKFVNPVNHQGGGVECVVSFEDLKK